MAAAQQSFESVWMVACTGMSAVSGCLPLVASHQWDQARAGSWMWVNCDLAISLPGGDKFSPCWCVNRSVITSACHDCLRMQASGNLHCRSFSLTNQDQRLFPTAQNHSVKLDRFLLHLRIFFVLSFKNFSPNYFSRLAILTRPLGVITAPTTCSGSRLRNLVQPVGVECDPISVI